MKKNILACITIVSMLISITLVALATYDIMPQYTYYKLLIDPTKLNYNVGDDVIFPSVLKASDYFTNPLGTYYLYYAPHDAPGGICLAYSNNIEGPYTEYTSNPVISKDWPPYYNVSHVSSPHAVWNQEAGKLYLYFHGENSATRLASSTNGINFSYENVCVTSSQFSGVTEASYARVFRYTIPSKGNTWIMLLMGNNGGTRKIYLAWSNDGKSWTTRTTPLISPNGGAGEGTQLASPFFYQWKGKNYVLYHSDETVGGSGKICVTEVGKEFDLENHFGTYYQPAATYPDENRAADPFIYTSDSVGYLFYCAGPRLSGRIALAKCPDINNLGALLVDDFQDGNANGWTTNGGNWSVIDDIPSGKMYLQNTASGAADSFTGSSTWTNYTAEALIKPLSFIQSNDGTGISARVTDAYNRYIFAYRNGPQKLQIQKKVNGATTTLVETPYTLTVGKSYSFKALLNESTLKFYVNGVCVLTCTDSSHTSGKVGLNTYYSTAQFDDIVVKMMTPFFSDNFNDNILGSAWTTYGGAWSESSQILNQTSTGNAYVRKATVSNSGVNFSSNHTITAKVKVNSWTDGDYARAGISLFTNTSDGYGYNLIFHNNHSTVQFLDDAVAWGPSFTFNWNNGTWYWFKLKMESGTLYGKVWQDGTSEPSNWPYSWTRSGRSGYPALNGGSGDPSKGNSTVSFDDVSVTSN